MKMKTSKLPDELRYIPTRAMEIKNSLGVKTAAGFLRNNGFSLEAAVWILLRISLKDYQLNNLKRK